MNSITHDDILNLKADQLTNLLLMLLHLEYKKYNFPNCNIKNCKSNDYESRVPNATKFWERMKNIFPENVIKNSDDDLYEYSKSMFSDLGKKIEG